MGFNSAFKGLIYKVGKKCYLRPYIKYGVHSTDFNLKLKLLNDIR